MKKRLLSALMVVCAIISLAVPAFCADDIVYEMPEIKNAFGSGLQVLWSNMVDVATIVLPVGIGIFSVYLVIGAGKKFVKMFVK